MILSHRELWLICFFQLASFEDIIACLLIYFFVSVGVVLYYVIVCLYLFGDLTIYAVAAPISVTKVIW